MQDKELFAQILGLTPPWVLADVQLDLESEEVRLQVVYAGDSVPCPDCGEACSVYDHGRERQWRHLDTCQMKTLLCSRVPRANCRTHGIRQIQVPWAEPNGRFTMLMEWVCIRWLLACRKQSQVAERMRLSADEVRHIMTKAVDRGMAKRDEQPVERLGIDEKSMKKGHHYLSVLSDLESGQVLDVAENRDTVAASALLNTLSDSQKQSVKSICMDMWPAFMNSAGEILGAAAVVHDRYHVSAHLNAAIDQTRRHEYREASEDIKEDMKGSRYLFTTNFSNLPDLRTADFIYAFKAAKQTATVYLCKEIFRTFWTQPSRSAGEAFLNGWIAYSSKPAIAGLTRVVNMLRKHREGLLNYLDHRYTNAVAEMLNGKIQELKTAARGFRSFKHYRIHILFHLGGLDLNPHRSQ
jgi:transposase